METTPDRLVLGGHWFIEQLGNDPEASFDEQYAIVSACLDAGARWIDTTYYQERVALGRVLGRLGRRDEARIIAWKFFRQPGRENDLVPWTPLEPDHLPVLLDELQTERIDLLVIHVHDDTDRLRNEIALAARWREAGHVEQIGLGMARPHDVENLPGGSSSSDQPVSQILAPYNAFSRGAAATFARAKARGLGTIAMSPFVRGLKLDEIGQSKAEVADILLRWVVHQPHVDRVDVAIRKTEWVSANLRSLARGPLTDDERARLDGWLA